MSTDTIAPDWVWDEVSDLDYSHAARVLRLPVGWLKEKAPAEEIPCTRYGKHVRFTPDDIREIRRMHRKAPAGAPVLAAVAGDEDRPQIRAALLKAESRNAA